MLGFWVENFNSFQTFWIFFVYYLLGLSCFLLFEISLHVFGHVLHVFPHCSYVGLCFAYQVFNKMLKWVFCRCLSFDEHQNLELGIFRVVHHIGTIDHSFSFGWSCALTHDIVLHFFVLYVCTHPCISCLFCSCISYIHSHLGLVLLLFHPFVVHYKKGETSLGNSILIFCCEEATYS